MIFTRKVSKLFTCLLFLAFVCVNFGIVYGSGCKLVHPDPKQQELLDIIKPLYGQTLKTNDGSANYTYKISICSKVEGGNDGIGAVQNTIDNHTYELGRFDKAEIMGGNNWILLTYYEGEKYDQSCKKSNRVAKIMIICDPEVPDVGKLQILEERKSGVSCYYLFELGSSVSCYKSAQITDEPKSYSSGSVFCILFFIFASAYLIIGFLYKRFVIGAKGLEQIPNYSFWKDFGNLQADGCDYVCRCGPRQESQAYRGIDDHLKIEDERDDQLLNM